MLSYNTQKETKQSYHISYRISHTINGFNRIAFGIEESTKLGYTESVSVAMTTEGPVILKRLCTLENDDDCTRVQFTIDIEGSILNWNSKLDRNVYKIYNFSYNKYVLVYT